MKKHTSLFSLLENACYTLTQMETMEFKNSELNKKLAQELHITPFQAMIFTTVFNHTVDDSYAMSMTALSDKMDMTNMKMFKHFSDLYVLQQKRLLDIEQRDRYNDFRVSIPKNTFSMILAGSGAEDLDFRPKTFAEVSERMNEIMRDVLNDSTQAENRKKAVSDLLDSVKHLPEIKWLKSLGLQHTEVAMVTYMMYDKIRSDDDTTSISEILERTYYSTERTLNIRNAMIRGRHILIRKGVVELSTGFFMDGTSLTLTELTCERLMGNYELYRKKKQNIQFKFLTHIKAETIQKKKLLFDEEMKKDLTRIERLLRPRSLKAFQKRAEERGLTKGLAVLMYGVPGTGKTETVKQYAARTGRDILLVNISDIRDKFVGESEKRLNNIFVEYEKAVKAFKKAPILVFNEADALISKRTAVNNSVDQMNNAMQNILLQRMEDFKGILVATTNLKSALDPAFERRFTLKLYFGLPSTEVYKKMLRLKLTDLTDEQIDFIGSNYRLTGGQMDNIVKNLEVKFLLGEEVDLDYLMRLCDAEGGKVKSIDRKPLGFQLDPKRRAS